MSPRLVLLASFFAVCANPLSAQVLLWDSTGIPVCAAEGWQRNPRMTGDGAHGAILAWEDMRDGGDPALYAARLRADGTRPWTPDGIEISPGRPGQRLAGIVSDGSGGAYIGWWDRAEHDGDISVQHVDAEGQLRWQPGGLAVCAAPGRQEWCEMAADGYGGVILTWHDRRNGNDNDIYVQRLHADGTAQWGADGRAVSVAPGEQSYPQLAADGNGGAYIVWMDRRVEDDIYAQHILPDGSPDWEEDFPVCVEANRQVAPKVTCYGTDAAAFFWQDYRLGPSTSALYLQIVNNDGTRLYPEDYQVSQSENTQSGMTLTADGQGGALAVWTDYRNDGNAGDVFMRRIRADGVIIGDFGNALCSYTDTQERPTMITDGHGGGFAVWQDKRNGFDFDLFMNRISAQGITQYAGWNGSAGVPLMKADNNQLAPQVIESGPGHAIVCWYDGRILDGRADIYAQRIAWAPGIRVPASVEFGSVKLGHTVHDTIRLWNDGARPLTISNLRRASDPESTHPQDFAVQQNAVLPHTIPAGASIDIVLSFTPGGMGERRSALRISSDAPEDPAIVLLRGHGTAPVMQLKSAHQFRPTKVGTTNQEEIADMIRNTGTGTLVIPRITVAGTDAACYDLGDNPPFPLIIEEGSSFALKLRFSPDTIGSTTAQLRIYSNADDEPREVRLSGIGAVPSLVTIPLSASFDSTMTTRNRDLEINIRNTSSVELSVHELTIVGEDAREFQLLSAPPQRIAGNGVAPVALRFQPTSVGTKRAELRIRSDAPSSPDILRITGTATLLGAARPPFARRVSVDALYPQPLGARQQLRLQLTLPDAARSVRVTLHDTSGRLYGTLFSGLPPSSSPVLALPLAGLDLAPGWYLLRIESGGQRIDRLFVRVD